jgi:peptide/nickel transport system ATP-binding protein
LRVLSRRWVSADITGGQVILDGQRIDDLSSAALRPLRRRVQAVFQDPFASLNPRMRVRDIVAEPIRSFRPAASKADMDARIDALLDKVRLAARRRKALAARITPWPARVS